MRVPDWTTFRGWADRASASTGERPQVGASAAAANVTAEDVTIHSIASGSIVVISTTATPDAATAAAVRDALAGDASALFPVRPSARWPFDGGHSEMLPLGVVSMPGDEASSIFFSGCPSYHQPGDHTGLALTSCLHTPPPPNRRSCRQLRAQSHRVKA
jgi:hypothetical protein